MYELNELEKQGKFKAKRDKDVLSTVIGSKKYGGRVRGFPLSLPSRMGSSRTGLAIGSMTATRKNCKKQQRKP
jgi:hypothetical protein